VSTCTNLFYRFFIDRMRLNVSGVRGRVVDLCKPTQRKYETAVSVVFGRNIDAVIVDEEKTAIDCIEVRKF
jgi:chromosome segregation ATPase